MKQVWTKGALALGVLALAACGAKAAGPAPGATPASAERKPVPVKVQAVERKSFSSYLRVTGTVKARNQIDVVAEESGILKEIRIENGRSVEAGAPLAVIDGPMVVAGRDQAMAALKQAELDQASKKLLFEKKAIAENDLLNSNYMLEAARANLVLAQTRVDKLVIRAPIAGIVNRRYMDRGAFIMPGARLFELIDLARVRIQAGVAERFLASVGVGTPVEVTFDAFPGLTVKAQVTYASRAIDPQTRTFDVEVEIDNPQGRIAPAMVANVRLTNLSLENQIVVPVDSLVETDQGWFVFVEENGKARKVPVKQVAVNDNAVMVDGLQPGQKLVVVGQRTLSDGDPLAPEGI
jgi:membrane fusion protein, multidrug efflux system